MTKENSGNYKAKHPGNSTIDPQLETHVRGASKDNRITCKSAEDLAQDLSIPISQVGRVVDLLEIKITECQLGVFGTGKENKAPDPQSEKLNKQLSQVTADKQLSCTDAWKVAQETKFSRSQVRAACDSLGIKIVSCQLGAF